MGKIIPTCESDTKLFFFLQSCSNSLKQWRMHEKSDLVLETVLKYTVVLPVE